MSRLRSKGKSALRYLHHKTIGQARVPIKGKCHNLGKYDTPESHEKYRRLIAEHWNPTSKPRPTATKPKAVTITALAIEYFKHAKTYYQKNGEPTSEVAAVRVALKRMRLLCSVTDDGTCVV